MPEMPCLSCLDEAVDVHSRQGSYSWSRRTTRLTQPRIKTTSPPMVTSPRARRPRLTIPRALTLRQISLGGTSGTYQTGVPAALALVNSVNCSDLPRIGRNLWHAPREEKKLIYDGWE
eukprot:8855120-Pyramimonas_sp.AAC.1